MGDADVLAATEIGLLQGGDRGAVVAALAMLNARGVLAAGAGQVRRTGSLPPERALYTALYGSVGPGGAGLTGVVRIRRDSPFSRWVASSWRRQFSASIAMLSATMIGTYRSMVRTRRDQRRVPGTRGSHRR
ncbi:hypothetical protein [Micromonospora tulbaghiae]|uniref:hypothetical protein n=1 Tax=Micromonospora tulbaghiae TaxID=479978 RepID=UPI0033CCB284